METDTGRRSVTAVSHDSILASVGVPSGFPTPLRAPEASGGVHFALVGNIWNTNYPVWYPFADGDAASQFRFRFDFDTMT